MNTPKLCSVPNCSNSSGSGDRRSFYKFPLQDQARLRQWLWNMGREDWTPTRHHYVCHQHFSASCFRVRRGVRYLETSAVPTLFHQNRKRQASDEDETSPKRLRSSPAASECDGADSHSLVYEITVETSHPTDAGPESSVSPPAPVGCEAAGTLLCVDQLGAQDRLVQLACIDVVPSLVPCEASLFPCSSDVVLCSALSQEPISSTLPIVSKHQQPQAHEERPEEPEPNLLLEEHCYHKLRLDPQELAVLQLQRKVKLLQRRHRRHVTKLQQLETTLNELRQNQLLERSYVRRSGAAASDHSETTTVVYEDHGPADGHRLKLHLP